MGKRFIAVPADALIAELEVIGQSVASIKPRPGRVAGGLVWSTANAGRERVCTVLLPGHEDARPAIRVFTSLAGQANQVRGCGEDAVRIVVGVQRPVDGAVVSGPDGDPRDPRVAFQRANATRGGFWPVQDEAVRVFRTAPKGEEGARIAAFLERLRGRLREAYAQAQKMPRCPDCGRVMRTRGTPPRQFLGCAGYPDACRKTVPLPKEVNP